MTRAEQTAKDDAAIATQYHGEMIVADCRRHALAEGYGIHRELGLIPNSSGLPHEVSIGGRRNVAQICCAQPLHETKIAQHPRRLIEMPGRTIVIRLDPDARRRSDGCNVAVHGLFLCYQ